MRRRSPAFRLRGLRGLRGFIEESRRLDAGGGAAVHLVREAGRGVRPAGRRAALVADADQQPIMLPE